MAFSHVIFDLDGTVLDTLTDLADAGNHVCVEHGWPTYPVDAYRYKVGNGMLKLVERFMPAEFAGNAALFDQALGEFRAFYAEHKEDTTAPYPGTLEMLDELRAPASSSPSSPTRTTRRRFRWSRAISAPSASRSSREGPPPFRPNPIPR